MRPDRLLLIAIQTMSSCPHPSIIWKNCLFLLKGRNFSWNRFRKRKRNRRSCFSCSSKLDLWREGRSNKLKNCRGGAIKTSFNGRLVPTLIATNGTRRRTPWTGISDSNTKWSKMNESNFSVTSSLGQTFPMNQTETNHPTRSNQRRKVRWRKKFHSDLNRKPFIKWERRKIEDGGK